MIHKTQIEKYSGTMSELVEDIGDLKYDSLSEFFKLLSKKLNKDSEADFNRGRLKQIGRAHV